jgi:hypothetical protein
VCCMQEASQSVTPAASGWGADFLKQNAAAQASQSAAIAQEIAEKQAPALPSLAGAFQPSKDSGKGTASKPEPVRFSWRSHCCMAFRAPLSEGHSRAFA